MNEKVSVIMGVFNAEETIKDSIDSILSQTYKNWEFIICDDASTDNTYKILLDYKNKNPNKFIILQNKTNSKLAFSLNRCLERVNGVYVARMDADDISKPERFERQINYLKEHNDVDLVGTAMQRFNDDRLNDIVYAPEHPDRFSLRNGVPFFHATILTYKSVYENLSGYSVSKLTERGEDYHLWFRFFFNEFRGENIKDVLYFVREDLNAIKRRTPESRFANYKIAMWGYKLLDYPIHWYIKPTLEFLIKASAPVKFQEYYRKYQAKMKKSN